ncbi:MAG: phosphohydrolase [Firmicutes bacterium]|nr:phosphohydrolase [Bacillota bacterium]
MNAINPHSGEVFSPFAPKIEQIHLIDIAHSLSFMCRANGHFDSFLSIAQHSINCAIEARERGHSKKIQLGCLFHDGSEAYISDIAAPVKQYLHDYLKLENHLQSLIYQKFLGEQLTEEEQKIVNDIDFNMLILEFNNLTNKEVFKQEPNIISHSNLKTSKKQRKTLLKYIMS